MSDLTNEQLAERISADLNEAEARMEAAEVSPPVIRRFKHGHAILGDMARILMDSGHVQPFSGGEPKP